MLLAFVLVINAPHIANFAMRNGQSGETWVAHAAAPDPANTQTTQATEKMLETVNNILGVQNTINRILWPVLYLIGGLLDNSLLFGGGMGDTLRSVWVPIRNIVNIFFVLALVGIALYNILGIGEEGGNYALKSVLPKLIVGIIAVNFSFLGMKVMIDAVNVLTTAIFALPAQMDQGAIFDESNPQTKKLIEGFCLQMADVSDEEAKAMKPDQINNKAKTAAYKRIAQKYGITVETKDDWTSIEKKIPTPDIKSQTILNELAAWKSPCNGTVLSDTGKEYFSRFKQNNVALAMAINMAKIPFLNAQDMSSIKSLDDLGKLMVNGLFGLIMYILFAASFIALLVVLFARVVVLWLSVAISPLLIVAMAVPAVKEQVKSLGEISEKFVKHLIAPIPIAFSLSIGWIMLKVFNSVKIQEGILANGTDYSMGFPIVGMSTLQEVIVAIGCVAIIWLGVFGAADGTMAAGVTNWMKEKLTAAGKFLGAAPFKYIPWIPISGGKYSLGALKYGAEKFIDKIDRPRTELVDAHPEWFETGIGPEHLGKATDSRDFVRTIKNDHLWNKFKTDNDEVHKELGRIANSPDQLDRITKDDPKLKQYIKDYGTAKDKTAREKAHKALLEYLDKDTKYSSVTGKSDSETTKPSAGNKKTPPAAPATTPPIAPSTPPPATNPAEIPDLPATGTDTIKPIKGTENYVDATGGIQDKKRQPVSAEISEKIKKEHAAELAEAQELAKAGYQAARASHLSAVDLATKNGYDKSTGDLQGQGKVVVTKSGTIAVSISEKEAYAFDPASGKLKKMTTGEISSEKPEKGTQVGNLDAGRVNIADADAQKITGKGKDQLAKLRKALEM